MLMQRLSVNRKSNRSCPKNRRQNTGTEKQIAHRSAAVMTECCAFLLFLARYFVMRRETVSGMPEAAAVASMAKTDSAVWYSPMPSEPRVRDRMMRYANPKNFSATENAVT